MDGFGNEEELIEADTPPERTENLDILIEDPDPDVEIEPNEAELRAEPQECENLEEEEEEESPDDIDSPRPSEPPSKKGKVSKLKRKRSSSEESSIPDGPDAGQRVRGPLSSTNKEINIGDEYQAFVADDISEKPDPDDTEDFDVLIYDTPKDVNENALLNFVKEVADRYLVPIDTGLFLLAQKNFDFDATISALSNRERIDEDWTEQEVVHFDNCFQIFGKNFAQMRIVLPHRSLRSIIRYYYCQKSKIKFKQFADAKLNESSSSESSEEHTSYGESIFEEMCENCGERAERMEMNEVMNRLECRACLVHYRRNNAPRATSLRLVLADRLENHIACPEYMREYMKEYGLLTESSDGSTFIKRKIGKAQKLEDIIEAEMSGSVPPENVIKEEVEEEKPSTSSTEKEETDEVKNDNNTLVWKKKHTSCMEQIRVLTDDSRRKMYDACQSASRVNTKEIALWKSEMASMKNRMERMNLDVDLIPSLLLSKERVRYAQQWTDQEKDYILKCFDWYGDQFDDIADVMGTKTPDQVYDFYKDNVNSIDVSSNVYEKRIRREIGGGDVKEEEHEV